MTIASNGRDPCPAAGALAAASRATPAAQRPADDTDAVRVDPTRAAQRGGAVQNLAVPRRPDVPRVAASPAIPVATRRRRGLREVIDVERRDAGARELTRQRAVERAEPAAAVQDEHGGSSAPRRRTVGTARPGRSGRRSDSPRARSPARAWGKRAPRARRRPRPRRRTQRAGRLALQLPSEDDSAPAICLPPSRLARSGDGRSAAHGT